MSEQRYYLYEKQGVMLCFSFLLINIKNAIFIKYLFTFLNMHVLLYNQMLWLCYAEIQPYIVSTVYHLFISICHTVFKSQ